MYPQKNSNTDCHASLFNASLVLSYAFPSTTGFRPETQKRKRENEKERRMKYPDLNICCAVFKV
jgi:hypothetical protein